jgi:hypothetical protein
LFRCMLYPNNFKLFYSSHSSSKRLSFQQFSLHLWEPILGLSKRFRTKSISSTSGWYENILETKICQIRLQLSHSYWEKQKQPDIFENLKFTPIRVW